MTGGFTFCLVVGFFFGNTVFAFACHGAEQSLGLGLLRWGVGALLFFWVFLVVAVVFVVFEKHIFKQKSLLQIFKSLLNAKLNSRLAAVCAKEGFAARRAAVDNQQPPLFPSCPWSLLWSPALCPAAVASFGARCWGDAARALIAGKGREGTGNLAKMAQTWIFASHLVSLLWLNPRSSLRSVGCVQGGSSS